MSQVYDVSTHVKPEEYASKNNGPVATGPIETAAHKRFDEHDKKKKETKKETNINAVPLLQIFRYATFYDRLLMLIGSLGAIGSGVSFPFMMLFFTNIIDSFTEYGLTNNNCFNINTTLPNASNKTVDLNGQMRTQATYLSLLGTGTILLGYLKVSFWMMPAERQSRKIRKILFASILKQDIAWFDMYKEGSLTNRLTDDVGKIKDGMGDKFGSCIEFISTFVGGMTIALVRGWKLSLVVLSLSPILLVLAIAFSKLISVLTNQELKSYAKAGSVAEEVISSIRTVFAFNGSQKDHARYEVKLDEARRLGIKKSIFNGLLLGSVFLVIYGAYALGFWYGWTLSEIDPVTLKSEYTVGKILLVFFSIIMAVFSLGNAAPFISTLAISRASAYEVFKIIDRKPLIDSSSDEGERLKNLIGNIEFRNVEFNYPSREEVKILNKISFKVQTGQTVALVGSSGSGKSTCIQLLQRFFDPLQGSVSIDNWEVRNLNINWLRSQLGVVNQEPVLFGTSIIENIRFGRDGITESQIIQAAKNANAHDFIMQLPQKYETLVGDRGSQLSGGQKQRIAIARALVRDPRILLLDEATSALDNESEAIVQAALDQARVGRTTIVVAHRLSTIRNADIIFAMDKGSVVESGTHEQLMSKKGLYYNLVISQETVDSTKQDKTKSKTALQRFISKDVKKEAVVDMGTAKETENKIKKDIKVDLMRVLRINKPEWYLILIGCLACTISGAINPAFAIIFSRIINVFAICDRKKQEDEVILYCILFVGIGVIAFFSNLIQSTTLGISGENITKRIRSAAFKAMLSQEIGWFDKPENNVGTLTTRLATEAAAVQGAVGPRLGGTLMNVANLGVGIVLAFIYAWAITLLILAFIPFIIISGALQMKMLSGFSGKEKNALEEAGKLTSEAITNIRTVVILNKERYFTKVYSDKIDTTYKASIRSANFYGFMLGFTTSIMFYALAAAFVLGAYLIEQRLFGLEFQDIMIAFSAVIFGAQSVGQATSLMPDYSKAKISIHNIFELLDRAPLINNWQSEEGVQPSDLSGDVRFDSVEFSYPSREEVKVLDKLCLSVQKGQKVALVGSSGCGKSTVTQLLERFYDPVNGEIKLNNYRLKDINLHWLRSQFGIVSQEPVLFDTSIAENIAYGDNSRGVSMDEIVEAAKLANIHDFISSLPEAYQTNVGAKGTQLSGGQKQRVSIARALVRNPKILVLDEATSALDAESEKIVQEALEKAQVGRTCIVIAHRLSTIRNSDLIFVIHKGKVSEAGTHDELMKLNGFYAKLNNKGAC